MDHRAAIESLADEVACPICRLDFEDPRILPCGHYYCRECIIGIATNAHPNLSFPCPECRRTTTIPENNPENLPKALFLNRVKSVLQSVLAAGVRPAVQCEAHGEPAHLYCADCHQDICQRCTTSEHLQHHYEAQTTFFVRLIKKELARLVEHKGKIVTAVEEGRSAQQLVQEECGRLSTHVNQVFEELAGIIQQRRQLLLEEVHALSDPSILALAAQRTDLQSILSQIEQVEEEVAKALQSADQLDKPQTKQLLHGIGSVILRCASINLGPKDAIATKVRVNTCTASDLRRLCQKDCKAYQVTDLSKCTVEGFQPTPSLLLPVHAVLHIRAGNGEVCSEKKAVNIALVNESMGFIMPCTILFHSSPGVYEFSYCAVYRGRHSLVVEVDGQPIPGSPFNVFAAIPCTQLGRPHRAIEANKTNSVAFGSDNLMVVNVGGADARVIVMDTQGKHILDIQDNIRTPNALAVDSENNIYAVDFHTCSLLKFSIQGQLLNSMRRENFPNGQFSGIGEIQIVKDELVFVCDTSGHSIHVLDKNLTYVRCIDCARGHNFTHPPGPSDLAYSKVDRRLFVSDSNNNCIQVYDMDGTLVKTFGHPGLLASNTYRLVRPWSLCLDKSETFLFVLDYAEHQVLVFTAAGKFIAAFGSKQLQKPARVAIDKDGYVYVCDEGANRIVVF